MPKISRNTLKTQAYEYLHNMIINGGFSTGEVYTEMGLAKELDISRTPVREAVLQLAQEDYVTLKPNKGFVIKQFTDREISDYLNVRLAIESFAASDAIKWRGSERFDAMIKRIEAMLKEEEAMNYHDSDFTEFLSNDNLFHLEIVNFSQNDQLIRIMSDLRNKMKLIGADSLRIGNRCEETIEEHWAIYDAIKSGTRAKIYSAYETHLKKALDSIIAVHRQLRESK